MSAFDLVLDAPHSVAARAHLAREWVGEPRGRLVALQLQAYRGLGPSNWDRIPDEIDELIRTHGREFAGPIVDLVNGYRFELGLVSSVNAAGATYATRGDDMVRMAPLVSLVIAPPGDVRSLAKVAALRNIRSLSMVTGDWLDDEAAIALAESPYSRELRFLYIAGGRIGQRGMQALGRRTDIVSIEVTGNPGASSVPGRVVVRERTFLLGPVGKELLDKAYLDLAQRDDGRVSWPPLDSDFFFDNDE